MKKLILSMLLCLIPTIASAGQQEDMSLCANKIKEQFKVDVIKKWLDLNENCKTNERHLVFSDSKELYDCNLNRKNNYIDVMNRKFIGEVATRISGDYQYMIDAAFPEKVPTGRCGLIRESYTNSEDTAINKSLFIKQAKSSYDNKTKETIEACKRAIKENADDDVIFYDYDKVEKDKEHKAYLVIGEQPAEFLGIFNSGTYKVLCYRASDDYVPSEQKTYERVTVWFKGKSGLAIKPRNIYNYRW